MDIKVSVILPVYNGEKTLEDCLGCLVNQTLREIEIIAVNNGSTDHSLDILQECQRQYPDKIVIYDCESAIGAGGARNAGLKNARGEYIAYVDCDGQPDVTMYEKLYKKAAEAEFDIVDSGFHIEKNKINAYTFDDSALGILNSVKRKKLIMATGYLWSKIFRKTFIREHKLKFRDSVPFEDIDFLTSAYTVAERVERVNYILYVHKNNPDSVTNTLSTDDFIKYRAECMQGIMAQLKRLGTYKEYKDIAGFKILSIYGNMLNNLIVGNEEIKPEWLSLLRDTVNELVKDYEKNKYIEELDPNIRKFIDMNEKDPEQIIKIQSEGKGLKVTVKRNN